jgi:hypothetical protein
MALGVNVNGRRDSLDRIAQRGFAASQCFGESTLSGAWPQAAGRRIH